MISLRIRARVGKMCVFSFLRVALSNAHKSRLDKLRAALKKTFFTTAAMDNSSLLIHFRPYNWQTTCCRSARRRRERERERASESAREGLRVKVFEKISIFQMERMDPGLGREVIVRNAGSTRDARLNGKDREMKALRRPTERPAFFNRLARAPIYGQ